MARVPLIKEEDYPELSGLIDTFRAGRRGRLINIYRMLLNSPALAESWFNHSNAVRWNTTLPGRLREIVIIRMGHLAQCEYVLRASTCRRSLSPTASRARSATRSPIGAPPSFSTKVSARRWPIPT